MKEITDTKMHLLQFIQDAAPKMPEMVNTKTLDEVAEYFIEQGIFDSKKDVKCFLFDAVPFMVSDRNINMDLPIRYYDEDEEIEESITLPDNDNIISFVKESSKDL